MKKSELKKQIEIALDEIRPFLIADGGDIELVNFSNKKISVKFLGTCTDCLVNKMTLKNGVEATIKNRLPQIDEVIAIV